MNGRPNPSDLIVADLKERFDEQAAAPAFDRIYDDPEFGHMFAVLHRRLNKHFDDINGRVKTTHHYWADNSRDLLQLIEDINQIRHDLRRAGVDLELDSRYQMVLEKCESWLSPSGGSAVPDDFERIEVITHEPVFTRPSTTVRLEKAWVPVELKMVGEGSYATVYSYVDPDYGIKFAVKRAKRGIGNRDLDRFKQEFAVMKGLNFPYILEVYKYDDERNEYRMEFCDQTLRSYIATRNSSLTFSSRRRIALQLLYGLNYIHGQGLLHRDISLQNVLLKVYSTGAVLVKLSDFGLVKLTASNFTRTETEMRGTIRDPLLSDFKSYTVINEMYSIGWVLSYIFTGREALAADSDEVSRIVQKCAAHDVAQRYQSVIEVIRDVERLDATSMGGPV